MHTDPIADYLTRLRNASKVRQRIINVPSSNIKLGITKVLFEMGYITNYKFVPDNKQGIIKIALKYDLSSKQPAFTTITRVSKPGLRDYTSVSEMPRVMNGLGIAIISTSKGVMTGKQAVAENVGGEVLCYVY